MMLYLYYLVVSLSSLSVINCEDNFCSEICASKTCCEKELGHFLCCPLQNGLCCPDANTCCPQGSQCNADGSCNIANGGLLSYSNQLFTSTPEPTNMSKRTTGASMTEDRTRNLGTCSPSETQCYAPSGTSGCCPFKDAVCCNDHSHCCPMGYHCNSNNASCIEDVSPEPISHLKIHSNDISDRECPASSSACPESQTCCQVTDDEQACCPLKDAECCPDRQHCCPKGTRCNSLSNGCDQIGLVNPFLSSARLNKTFLGTRSEQSNLICPDRKSTCVDGSTCCKMRDDSYGCCPTTNAVCCSDGLHCCPEGFTCNNESGTCSSKPRLTATTTTEKPKTHLPKSIACDREYTCPDDSTCCQIADHTWGCCPFPKAVCCSDGRHCCPSGNTCDLKNEQCIDKVTNSVSPWLDKMSISSTSNTSFCPDNITKCPDSSTCCQSTAKGGPYACCPHTGATCCSDGEHCCPKGHVCHESGCMMSTTPIVPFTEKIQTEPPLIEVTVCPDGLTKCTINLQCCQASVGDIWSCCPIKKENP